MNGTKTMPESLLSSDEFRYAFRNHPAGVAVITADNGSGPVAMTVSSLSSVGIDPPTLVFSASGVSSSTPTICAVDTLVVHLLTVDQAHLARLAATSGSDRFGSDVQWDRLPTGEPYYPEASAWLRGRVVNRVETSGSTLLIVEALEAKPGALDGGPAPAPLVYHNRTWHRLSDASALA